jgi:Fanconi anemia group M protein
MLLQERQQFIIEGLPNISGVIAQRLLAHFGSVGAVLEASEKDLMKVKGVGKKIAKGIRETLDAPYYSKEKE